MPRGGAARALCSADGADLDGARAEGAAFVRTALTTTRWTGATLRRALWSGCDLEQAVFDGADLTLATLARSKLDGASFRDARLRRANGFASTFLDADLSDAHDLAYCREAVHEILRRGYMSTRSTRGTWGRTARRTSRR